jgi:hypothetical protein
MTKWTSHHQHLPTWAVGWRRSRMAGWRSLRSPLAGHARRRWVGWVVLLRSGGMTLGPRVMASSNSAQVSSFPILACAYSLFFPVAGEIHPSNPLHLSPVKLPTCWALPLHPFSTASTASTTDFHRRRDQNAYHVRSPWSEAGGLHLALHRA